METRTVICVNGATVTVLNNQIFRDVAGSFKAPVLVRLASEAALFEGFLEP